MKLQKIRKPNLQRVNNTRQNFNTHTYNKFDRFLPENKKHPIKTTYVCKFPNTARFQSNEFESIFCIRNSKIQFKPIIIIFAKPLHNGIAINLFDLINSVWLHEFLINRLRWSMHYKLYDTVPLKILHKDTNFKWKLFIEPSIHSDVKAVQYKENCCGLRPN